MHGPYMPHVVALGRLDLDDLSPELRQRYFVPEGEHLRISRAIRERCVFAQHDLARQPPFMRMDLISCRNLLIYFQASLQDEVFVKFHHALVPGGYLLLGRSESFNGGGRQFEVVDRRGRLYRRKPDDSVAAASERLPLRAGQRPPEIATLRREREELRTAIDKARRESAGRSRDEYA